MKKIVAVLLFFCAFFPGRAQNTDLPNPDPNLQTLPAGSYVIAMDNTLQVNSSGSFNLKAYGLLVYLLNNNVRLRWCIKAGKLKDDIDFSAPADQLKPALSTGGTIRNFKAGPFVIKAADTSGVAALVDAFYTANALTGANRPKVYRLTADAPNVDIRYDLWGFRPKAAVLTDGGNQGIHLAYMTACSIPTESYATSQGTDLLSNCFTFASEPHNSKTGTAVNNAISAIRDFVSKGGNFLAQCEAINNYENNSLGRFQTTGGLTNVSAGIGTALLYGNPDLSFSQIEGVYDASSGGSLRNWKIIGSPANNEHNHATGTGTNSNVIGASVSKHFYGKGGLVFYIGNHSFATTTVDGINGIRMYMNAFLTPSNTNCPSLVFSALPVKLLQFGFRTGNSQPVLSWKVTANEEVKHFVVETSTDGVHFFSSTTMAASGAAGEAGYQFANRSFVPGNFYRLKIEDLQGRVHYSALVQYKPEKVADQLVVLANPIQEDLLVGYTAAKNTKVTLHLFHASGTLLYTQTITCVQGSNIIAVPAIYTQQRGIYYLDVTDQTGIKQTAKAVRL